MERIITIPKEIARKGELVLIPRSEYEEFLRLRKQREWEERDTDEAVKIFKKEKGEKKLIKIKSLAEIHGKYRDYWAFSIDNSYRIMFRFLDATKSVAAFINVGTHEIYK